MADYKELGKSFGGLAKRGRDVASIAFVHLAQAGSLDDVTITENADLFIQWDENWTGKKGVIVRDDGQLYKSIHDILTPAQNTKPSITPAMWTLIGDPNDEWPEWSQPIGVHDAYMQGAKVTYEGQHYVSLIDNNIWSPEAYPQGWELVN